MMQSWANSCLCLFFFFFTIEEISRLFVECVVRLCRKSSIWIITFSYGEETLLWKISNFFWHPNFHFFLIDFGLVFDSLFWKWNNFVNSTAECALPHRSPLKKTPIIIVVITITSRWTFFFCTFYFILFFSFFDWIFATFADCATLLFRKLPLMFFFFFSMFFNLTWCYVIRREYEKEKSLWVYGNSRGRVSLDYTSFQMPSFSLSEIIETSNQYQNFATHLRYRINIYSCVSLKFFSDLKRSCK